MRALRTSLFFIFLITILSSISLAYTPPPVYVYCTYYTIPPIKSQGEFDSGDHILKDCQAHTGSATFYHLACPREKSLLDSATGTLKDAYICMGCYNDPNLVPKYSCGTDTFKDPYATQTISPGSPLQGAIEFREIDFGCNYNWANTGVNLYCSAKYEITKPGTLSTVIEACIKPKVGWIQALAYDVGDLGQCYPGETFCNAQEVIPDATDKIGDVFTTIFKITVPSPGMLTHDGKKAYVGSGELYNIVRTSVTRCCNDPKGCQSTPTYGWGQVYKPFTIVDPTEDKDKDLVPDTLDKCPNTPNMNVYPMSNDYPKTSWGCEWKIWEACIANDGSTVCKGSSNPDLIFTAYQFPPDTMARAICTSFGLKGTGSAWDTEQRCKDAIATQPSTIMWELCDDGTCESSAIILGADAYLICSQKGKNGAGAPYYWDEAACLASKSCDKNKEDICADGTKRIVSYCVGGREQLTNLKCPIIPPPPTCGNNQCDSGENTENCQQDCGTDKIPCGQGCILYPSNDGWWSGDVEDTKPVSECDDGWCYDTKDFAAGIIGLDDGICTKPGWYRTTPGGVTVGFEASAMCDKSPDGYSALCGNGKVDPPEECDDKNNFDEDECSNTCLYPGADCGKPSRLESAGILNIFSLPGAPVCKETRLTGDNSGPISKQYCKTGWCFDPPLLSGSGTYNICAPPNFELPEGEALMAELRAGAVNQPAAYRNEIESPTDSWTGQIFARAMCKTSPPCKGVGCGVNETIDTTKPNWGCSGKIPNGQVDPGESCGNCKSDMPCATNEKCAPLTRDNVISAAGSIWKIGPTATIGACALGALTGIKTGITLGPWGAAAGGVIGCVAGGVLTEGGRTFINRATGATAEDIADEILRNNLPVHDCYNLKAERFVFEMSGHWCNVDEDCVAAGPEDEDWKCNVQNKRCVKPGFFDFLNDWAKSIEDALGVKGSGYVVLGIVGLIIVIFVFKIISPSRPSSLSPPSSALRLRRI